MTIILAVHMFRGLCGVIWVIWIIWIIWIICVIWVLSSYLCYFRQWLYFRILRIKSLLQFRNSISISHFEILDKMYIYCWYTPFNQSIFKTIYYIQNSLVIYSIPLFNINISSSFILYQLIIQFIQLTFTIHYLFNYTIIIAYLQF